MDNSSPKDIQEELAYKNQKITLMLCPDSILLPMSSRTKEMQKIIAHNSAFFSNIFSNLSKDIRQNLETLWTMVDRDCMDDLQWLQNVRQILSKSAKNEYFWKKWCCIVGCDEENFYNYYLKIPQNKSCENLINKGNVETRALRLIQPKCVNKEVHEK
ncbi:hypothetical protein PORY_002760 [Pneumocystis oryctolagi]|uniref:Uncharacterized protein n=1 Tax=Pneumocystis oryctolagi TaxID=42067 RepID=A0ACB7C8J0_9ASCO|nr:hypothetical protein PORY_002760 [Pneumocystis oryctolagi]